jgi:glycosyltransferase involved in cell wall biosynthesis
MAIHYSIIIPTLNEEKFLPKLLISLGLQTRRDFEVIVVDGASRDNTIAIAQSFKKKLPHLTTLSVEHPNISRQRNTGAEVAKGSWFIFIDADSILLPYALERADAFVQEKKPRLFTTWFRSDTETPSDSLITLLFDMVIESSLLLHRPSTQGTFMAVEKKAFIAVGGFNEKHLFGEDHDLVTRLTKKGIKLQILRETLYVYSLRRLRYQKTLKTLQSYARSVFSVLLTNETPRAMPGYIMGGAPYNGKKARRKSVARQFNKKFRAFMREVFE